MNTTISEPTIGPGPPAEPGPAEDALLARYQSLAASDSISAFTW